MLYAIVAEDVPDSLERRKSARPEHLRRLQALCDAGRLILAGPNPAVDAEDPGTNGFSGSVIIAEFESLDAALAWADNDPYRTAGGYAGVSVKPFKLLLP